MMTEAEALKTLAQEDPAAAGRREGRPPLAHRREGLETISLLRLQEFLWYALPGECR